jgi:hypothetical protein
MSELYKLLDAGKDVRITYEVITQLIDQSDTAFFKNIFRLVTTITRL